MTQTVKTVIRFTPEVMKTLVNSCPKAGVDANTTDLQAGFLLGVQFVLAKIREGFAHESG